MLIGMNLLLLLNLNDKKCLAVLNEVIISHVNDHSDQAYWCIHSTLHHTTVLLLLVRYGNAHLLKGSGTTSLDR